jgi:hypothetical protein
VITSGLESGSHDIKIVLTRFHDVKIELASVGGFGGRDGICTSEYRYYYAGDGSAVRANDDAANTSHFRWLINTYVGSERHNCKGHKCCGDTYESPTPYDCPHRVNCMLACQSTKSGYSQF